MLDPPIQLGRLGGLTVRLAQRTQFVCPFCKEVVVEADTLTHDMATTESTLHWHLRSRHPVRWRLNRRFRSAMGASRG